jgi:hypothetical protein
LRRSPRPDALKVGSLCGRRGEDWADQTRKLDPICRGNSAAANAGSRQIGSNLR